MTNKVILSIPEDKIHHLNCGNCRKNRNSHTDTYLVVGLDSKTDKIVTLVDSRFYNTDYRIYNITWISGHDVSYLTGAWVSGYTDNAYTLSQALKKLGCKVTSLLEDYGLEWLETAYLEIAELVNTQHNLGYTNLTLIHTYA